MPDVAYQLLPSYNQQDGSGSGKRTIIRRRSIVRYALALSALFLACWTLASWLWDERIRPPPSLSSASAYYQPGDFGVAEHVSPQRCQGEDISWPCKAHRVREAFQQSYHAYEEWAWGHDELFPISHEGRDNFNGWGVTLFDSLDTMLLMGLKEEFARAITVVEGTTFPMAEDKKAPFFETVIRYLGGLLSAYALSGEPVLLQKADDLGRMLSPAFETPSGFPVFSVNPATGVVHPSEFGLLAEIASCQLEYTYLAKATGKVEHWEKADGVIQSLAIANLSATAGMLPMRFDLLAGEPFSEHLSVGSGADSAHEYLLKQYLLTAKTDKTSLEMYLRMTTYVLTNLTFISPQRGLMYVTDAYTPNDEPSHRQEHLSCFFPGLLALGAHTLPLDDLASVGIDFAALGSSLLYPASHAFHRLSRYPLRDLHLWAARGLAQTCYLAYADQRSGLAPDEVDFTRQLRPGNRQSGPWHMNDGWMDLMDAWDKKGRTSTVPGTEQKEKVVYDETYEDELQAMVAPPADGMGKAEAGGKAEPRPRPPKKDRDYVNARSQYFLRPETVESMYILWRTTGEEVWRHRGWEIFETMERTARVAGGYASIWDVDLDPAPVSDDMPSFFLAETLKYLYLLFTDADLVPLDKWVFNTEAHPLPVFEWTDAERQAFGIPGAS